jgi:hypothetical protein
MTFIASLIYRQKSNICFYKIFKLKFDPGPFEFVSNVGGNNHDVVSIGCEECNDDKSFERK